MLPPRHGYRPGRRQPPAVTVVTACVLGAGLTIGLAAFHDRSEVDTALAAAAMPSSPTPAAPAATGSSRSAAATQSVAAAPVSTAVLKPYGILAKRWKLVTPLRSGAVGDGRTDDTAALQHALDALRPGEALNLPSGRTFAHSGLLHLRNDDTALVGGGTLLATVAASSALWVEGDRSEVSGITVELRGATQRLSTWDDVGVRIAGTTGTVLRDVEVRGSASAGIMVDGSSRFSLEDVLVEGTLADGIHVTDGSHDGRVVNATTRQTGDDGIAVVGYRNLPPVRNITITSPEVEGTEWGRGLSVVGGEHVTFTDVSVADSSAAAIYIAAEAGWKTWAAKDVSVTGGEVTGSNRDAEIDHGAVLVYNGDPSQVVEDIDIDDLKISGTASHASREVGIIADQDGAVTAVRMSRISIDDASRTAFVSNSSHAGYRLTDWSIAGSLVPDRLG